jgi:hypothetical protein
MVALCVVLGLLCCASWSFCIWVAIHYRKMLPVALDERETETKVALLRSAKPPEPPKVA